MSEYSTTHRRPIEDPLADWEKELLAPRTITVPALPANTQHTTAQVSLVDAIAAVQDAGYLVYEIGELPEVTTTPNGNQPKLPSHWGSTRKWIDGHNVEVSRVQAYYEEAFGKLALARWWEAEERRLEKQKSALAEDLRVAALTERMGFDEGAAYLIERGWRRG